MKTLKSIQLTIVALLCSIPVCAHDFEVDGVYYNIISEADLTIEVTYRGDFSSHYYAEYAGEVVIPDKVVHNGANYSVTNIGYFAFEDCYSLTHVTIPNSITTIQQEAFSGCVNLGDITIPNSITAIGPSAFQGCLKLPVVNYVQYADKWAVAVTNSEQLSYTLRANTVGLASWIFAECINMEKIEIPNMVKNIGSNAFRDCWSLAEFTIPNSVTKIMASTFYGCTDLTNITIPNSITSIGDHAFDGCHSLTNITIPNSVISIGDYAFDDCNNLRLVINYSNLDITKGSSSYGNVAYYADKVVKNINTEDFIGDYFFRTDTDGNHYLSVYIGNDTILVLPEDYQGQNYSIAERAFFGYSRITSITIPNSVTSIGNYAFYGCENLMGIIIPNSVTSIGYGTFYNCKNLANITFGNLINKIDLDMFNDCTLKSLTIGAGVTNIVGTLVSKPAKTIWLTNTPPDGCRYAAGAVNYVANDQYSNLSDKKVYPFLSSMFEVNGVTYVPVNMSERTCDAIDGQYNNSVENLCIDTIVSYKGIAMAVKEIMPYTFYKNGNIKVLNINNTGNIGKYAFYGCDSIQTVRLGGSIINIGESAFEGCKALEKISIPNSVITLEPYSFSDCSSMQEISLCNGVTTLGNGVFSGCFSLSSISIPSSVLQVSNKAFYGCTAMSKVVIEDRTETLTLGSNDSSPLFGDCPLDSVYIGGKISYNSSNRYGYSPFYRNISLETVVFSDREETVYDNEFYGCTNLKNVTIGDGVTSIGDWAFSGCSGLDYFAFGKNVKSIGKEAFSDCTNVTLIISHAVVPPTCGTQALDDINKYPLAELI